MYFCIQNTVFKIMVSPIEQSGLSQLAYERIKAMILTSQLKPGDKIIQERLAKELGVSRMPLHRAFQMLEDELLLVSVPRRGMYVREITLSDVVDAFECREALETVAIRRVASVISSAQIQELRALFTPFHGVDSVNVQAYELADAVFHRRIIELSGNRMLIRLEVSGNIVSLSYLKGLIRQPEETLAEHEAIIRALEQHNADLAEKLIRQHARLSIARISETWGNH